MIKPAIGKTAVSRRQLIDRFKLTVGLMLLPCALLLNGCTGIQSALDPAGPQASKINQLWWLMFTVLSFVFLIVMVLLLIAIVRRKRQPGNDESHDTPEPVGERTRSQVVTAGVVLTTLILFVLLVGSFLAGRSLHALAASESKPLTIDITGQQWWWQVKYENDTPSQMVTTANEIHIPVGRTVLFKLRSNDVIHSFWVPNLHGKTDLIPGHLSATTIRADRPGTYRGQCAEFCGHQHAHMAFTIIAESEEAFRTWYAAQLQSAIQPATPQTERGRQIFLSSPCVMCHRIQGTDAGGAVGPDLTHVGSRRSLAADTFANTREHLAQWIVDSQSIKPGNHMPPMTFSNDELQALLDYLQSLN